ncbi:hypothetical protein M5K25_016675 [Dendrobium thyrsiflorum]|uniref:Uncharacterized protein n=1 Tax=Dendrobium thyrsiflorum TaxID=117978 RepID=A0ABD0UKV2_DENTH
MVEMAMSRQPWRTIQSVDKLGRFYRDFQIIRQMHIKFIRQLQGDKSIIEYEAESSASSRLGSSRLEAYASVKKA